MTGAEVRPCHRLRCYQLTLTVSRYGAMSLVVCLRARGRKKSWSRCVANGRSSQLGCGTGEATATRDQIDQRGLSYLISFLTSCCVGEPSACS